jgi:DNA-binding MarR family transcriptional regulator
MSRPDRGRRRGELLGDLMVAGRNLSDAVVMYHTALGERLRIGPSEWKTLGLLEQEGPLTAGDLSERTGLAPPSVTGILDRLEAAGWIERTRDVQDKRRVIVTLVPEATAERYGYLFEGLRRRLTEIYDQYSDEQLEAILGVLRELAAAQREATRELRETDGIGRS